MAYSYCTQNMDEKEEAAFQETIGQRHDPAKQALEELAAYQESIGMVFEDPDKPVPPDAKAQAWMADQEIDGDWMGSGRK